MDRRDFLKFLGLGSATLGLTNCALTEGIRPLATLKPTLPFNPIAPSSEDQLILPGGINYDLLIKWGDPLIGTIDFFGFNNDYLALIPIKDRPQEYLLWVNHEYVDPLFVSGFQKNQKRESKTKSQVDAEIINVGASVVHLKRESDGSFRYLPVSPYNRRLNARTALTIAWPDWDGERVAYGTLANCAGGITPWQTVLTCEENYQNFVGEIDYTGKIIKSSKHGWERYYSFPPEHYGWVVEVDPFTGIGKKLIALGRFCHESAYCLKSKDQSRVVVYSGDDAQDQHLYKFISDSPNSLESGELFVAKFEFEGLGAGRGEWISLKRESHPELQKQFKTQTEIQIHTRLAAKLVGATPLDRPEDIEVNPHNGDVIVALTNNLKRNNLFGSLLKISEDGGDYLSKTFHYDTLLWGGEKSGFACPDNLAFDPAGNLWMTTDMSGTMMRESKDHAPFKNNGLFYIPFQGPYQGQAYQFASAPIGSELTGPCFTPEGDGLFLSVQHPGEGSTEISNPLSRWPHLSDGLPRPGVVFIQGAAFQALS